MIKHLTPRSIEELETREKELFSGRLLKDLSYDELAEIVHLIRPLWQENIKMKKRSVKAGFFRGQLVIWTSRQSGEEHKGRIIRLNSTTASIEEHSTMRWKVSYNLLRY